MNLPNMADLDDLIRERNVPRDTARELTQLAKARANRAVRIVAASHSAIVAAAERAATVREEFLWSLFPDRTTGVTWPWEEMNRKYGSLQPGDVHIPFARTNVGKTTYVLNVVDSLLEREIPVHYLPFETPPRKLVALLAAIRLRLNPVFVARNEWDRLPDGSLEAITKEGTALLSPPYSSTLSWAPQGTMKPVQVFQEFERAAECGTRVVVVDHLHRIELPGKNTEAELRKLSRELKDRAEKLGLIVICCGQANRGERDPLRRHLPPVDTDIRGAGAIEEEADGVIGLYLPLIEGITPEQMKAARAGIIPLRPLVRKNTAGSRILKHRIDGSMVGEDVFLVYDHGRLLDPQTPLRDFGKYDV